MNLDFNDHAIFLHSYERLLECIIRIEQQKSIHQSYPTSGIIPWCNPRPNQIPFLPLLYNQRKRWFTVNVMIMYDVETFIVFHINKYKYVYIYIYTCMILYSMSAWVDQPTNFNKRDRWVPVALRPRHVVMRLRCASASMRSSERRAEVNSLSMVRTLPPWRRRSVWRTGQGWWLSKVDMYVDIYIYIYIYSGN